MSKKLYVGNLSHSVDDSQLQELFESYGSVASAKVITDRETNRSRGFGFVEMVNEEGAQAAIQGLNGQEAHGRTLTVNIAKPRENRGPSGGGRMGGYRDRRMAGSGGGYNH